jgi:hypothetical protein
LGNSSNSGGSWQQCALQNKASLLRCCGKAFEFALSVGYTLATKAR